MTDESENKPERPRRMRVDTFLCLAFSAVTAFFLTCGVAADVTYTGRGVPSGNSVAIGVPS